MRLIDANTLKSMVTGYTKPHEFQELIDRRPTVRAIPIEWIKKWASHWSERYWVYKDTALQIIEDWEKENEK